MWEKRVLILGYVAASAPTIKIFFNTNNVINDKLCMIEVSLIKHSLFMPPDGISKVTTFCVIPV